VGIEMGDGFHLYAREIVRSGEGPKWSRNAFHISRRRAPGGFHICYRLGERKEHPERKLHCQQLYLLRNLRKPKVNRHSSRDRDGHK
jgi:hypothetical protein